MIRRSFLLGALPPLARPALAQPAWPSRPIRMIVPWPPGQSTDLVGRLMAQRLTERLGQSVVPENKPGAGGAIGTDAVAKAAPDGYTLLAASIGPISFGPLMNRLPYDVERDLAPVAAFSGSHYLLVVRADSPARDAAGLLAMLRASPGRYSYASSGAGGSQHLFTAMFAARAGVDALHVPYQGSGPAMAALLGGQVDFAIESTPGCLALIRDGKLRALGTTVGRRSAIVPEVPPLAEAANLPGYDYIGWVGMMAPAATPRPILDRLSTELGDGLKLEETRQRLIALGTEAAWPTPTNSAPCSASSARISARSSANSAFGWIEPARELKPLQLRRDRLQLRQDLRQRIVLRRLAQRQLRLALTQQPLHALDGVALRVEQIRDALQQREILGPVVAPAAAALQRLELRELRLPEAQDVLGHIQLIGRLADGAEGLRRFARPGAIL